MVKLYSQLAVTNQSRGRAKAVKPFTRFLGCDTETFEGKAYLICMCDEDGISQTLKIPFDSEEGLELILAFLVSGERQREVNKAMRTFYNLNYDVRAILRWFPVSNVDELYRTGKTNINGYKITFLSKKFFRISRPNQDYSVTYFDIAQFYGRSLDFNAKKYLNDEKVSTIDSSVLGSSITYWYDNYETIVEYCIHDCYLTAKLTELFFKKLETSMNFVTKKPYSTGSISQEYFLQRCYIPTVQNIPTEVLALHQDGYRGGRIELLKKGYFESVNAYDIKSAYPAHMRNLIDYSQGNWYQVAERDSRSDVGIYRIRLSWYHEYVAPFPVITEYGSVYPNGEYEVIANEKELDFLDKYSEFNEYEILDGWEFNSYRNEYPYRAEIDRLFTLKETTKDDTERLLYKLFINSIYGKTAQAIDRREKGSGEELKYTPGKLWNPLYCCRITALTRLQLLDTAMPIIEDVIGFATDSIHTTGSISVPSSPQMGDFTVEEEDVEGIFLMAGIRWMNDKSKMRGFSDKLDLKEILMSHPDKSILPIDLTRPVTVYEALRFKDVSFEDMNIFKTEARELNINGDVRRTWKGRFENSMEMMKRYIGSAPILL